ncbi:MAG: hypothetical protein ACRDGT_12740, partial [Candidatus Limnocylindria bacterium]
MLTAVSMAAPPDLDLVRIGFWIAVTLFSAALPIRLPGGVTANTTTTPIIAAVFDTGLANPFALCWIALLGTTDMRDVRRQTAFWPVGTLYNRLAYVLAAFAAWAVADGIAAVGVAG